MDTRSTPDSLQCDIKMGAKTNLEPFANLILNSEDWLVYQILNYAKARGYSKYMSTLQEAWRLSISGLSKSLLAAIKNKSCLELSPDDDYARDPVASFGIVEAQRHRERGVDLGMFLGLMKYYRQSYLDLVRQAGFKQADETHCLLIVERFFDRVEIGFCTEWASAAEHQRREKLQGVLEMAGAICHELNQPLQVVSGLSHLLTFDIETDSPVFKKIKTIINQVDKMGNITGKLQRITRYETMDYLENKIIDIERATDRIW